ncbi:LysR family transcriptional regulator [Limnohabitans radicicola]|uniref:LysR family transcriptional regulator n=1 Tax=Limnohabitans radicicola TaxID=2771427 RepID=A0A927FK96_9BURK|nr:LysR family transcriptional regulator [Limnohabitans radicicola]MBD8051643.1 LysR family transcriptional regulator [Limnohabitans radicicola]
MNIKDLDLNLLRLFDAVWRSRSVSLAAQQLGMSQPAASQGLARLRAVLGDALFERHGAGVRPTPRADRLAQSVQLALATIEEALNASQVFDPKRSGRVLRVHLSDIGEARFLPELVLALQRQAPGMRLEALPMPHDRIGAALDNGQLDLAIGFLPEVTDTLAQPLLSDRYVLLMRQGHPMVKRWRQLKTDPDTPSDVLQAALAELEFAAVRTHADTLRILELMRWQHRLRLTVSHFLSLPAIVRSSDLAVLMPRNFAQGFAVQGTLDIIEPELPLRDFVVSMHWSQRFSKDPCSQWFRATVAQLFNSSPP